MKEMYLIYVDGCSKQELAKRTNGDTPIADLESHFKMHIYN